MATTGAAAKRVKAENESTRAAGAGGLAAIAPRTDGAVKSIIVQEVDGEGEIDGFAIILFILLE